MSYKIQNVKYDFGCNKIHQNLIEKILSEMEILSKKVPPLGKWMDSSLITRVIELKAREGEKNFYSIKDTQRIGAPAGIPNKTGNYVFEGNTFRER